MDNLEKALAAFKGGTGTLNQVRAAAGLDPLKPADLRRNNAMEKQSQYQKPYFVVVDNVQVFTADFVFEQLSANGRRIDTARGIAVASAIISVLSVIICIVILCS